MLTRSIVFGLAIIHEDIGRTIGIAGDEIAGVRGERHIAAVAR